MKRTLLLVGAVVLVLVLLAAAAIASAFIGRKEVTDGTDVRGIRIVKDGIVSAAVVPVGPRQVALIDAGNDTEGTAVLAELQRRGLTPDAVVAVLLTHGHADHTGAIRKLPNAQVMALEAEVPLVEGRVGARGPLLRLMPVSPTGITVSRALHDGDTLTIGEATVRVFATPGHTQGSASYLVNGALFVGDSADADSEGTLQGAPWIFSDSQSQNHESLIRLDERLHTENLPVSAIVPAHSGVMTDGLTQLDRFARSAR